MEYGATIWNLPKRIRSNLIAASVVIHSIVRDSSAVRRLFVRLAGAVGRQSALHKEHKENSGFADATMRRHISTFRGYQILFSIRNPYINRFTNHFSIHSCAYVWQYKFVFVCFVCLYANHLP
jgi:hypothetical protein